MCLQFGQAWIWTSASARCERRRPFFDLDSLTFGRAMARGFYGMLASGRPVCRLFGLLDLVRQVEPDLVDQLHELILVEHDLSRERDMARVLDQILETVKQLVDLYLNFSFSALATGGGTRSETFPP